MKVGAAGSRFRHDPAALVGEQTHGLGAAGVDPEHMHARRFYVTLQCPMRGAVPRTARRRCAAALVAVTITLCLHLAGVVAQTEVRALWVVRTSLVSPSAIATMVSAARESGFNTLLVQIRGRADAYYAGGFEPRASAIAAQPAFDPLATTVALAHDAGLQVHAWVNVNLVAGGHVLPASRDHVIYRHPEWLMVPHALAEDLAGVNPRSPEYLGRLARYGRGQPSELEGR